MVAEVQRRVVPVSRARLEPRARVDEHGDLVGVAARRGPVQGGHAVTLCRIHIRALLQELADQRRITAHGGIRNRRIRDRSPRANEQGEA